MSLLIKALSRLEKESLANDSLEKNKQLDNGQKRIAEYVEDVPLSLELMPVDAQIAESQSHVASTSVDELTHVKAERVFLSHELSLEEEAGLSDSRFLANKYAKQELPSKAFIKPSKIEAKGLKNTINNSAQTLTGSAKNNPALLQVPPSVTKDKLNQTVAAKLFVANKAVKKSNFSLILISLGVAGALLVLIGYHYVNKLITPPLGALKPNLISTPQLTLALTAHSESPPSNVTNPTSADVVKVATTSEFNNTDKKANLVEKVTVASKSAEPNKVVISKLDKNNVFKSRKKSFNDSTENGNHEATTKNQPPVLALISKAQASSEDPTLLSAYQAYIRGEDAKAQQQYRQVLQQDIRNVDALLGMAAVAQRQGRDADAQGWYQKVLEIEPRNSIAQAAIESSPNKTGDINAESRIKNMLVQQPESANLHAALGNLYAEQNQWSLAQEAYFNASRLAPNNADYAFNLAVSLDQMAKPSLALAQYQRALELLDKSVAKSPDRAQLVTRIRELQ